VYAGPIIGMPFSWEGTAFFLEAIALGIFLYGWNRVSPWLHWASGVVVGVSGVFSALFVVCANAWMNAPAGFDWNNGHPIHIDPWAAMFNRAALGQGLHMAIAAFAATGFAVAGVHAIGLLRDRSSRFHREAMKIALVIGAVAAILQPIQGDRLAKQVTRLQPAKLAAMEELYETSQPAPLLVGLPGVGFHIPRLLSFLAKGDFNAKVDGLDVVPERDWPPVLPTHLAFDLMVGIGSLLAALGGVALYALVWKRPLLERMFFLRVLVLCAPLGFLAIEAGWVVTEVGRQPWIIYGLMRTEEAVTPMPGLIYPMSLFSSVYLFLSFVVVMLITRQFRYVR
jgi:cytochrome d ubiquinol oxidase subunit I